MRGSAGEASNAIAASRSAMGTRNQKDLPNSVMWSKISGSHTGARCAAVTAGASTTIMVAAIMATATTVLTAKRSDARHNGGPANFGLRAKSAKDQATLARTQCNREPRRSATAAFT